jgi:hypothetical protein
VAPIKSAVYKHIKFPTAENSFKFFISKTGSPTGSWDARR